MSSVFAGDFYWVGNSGNWNDPMHWSSTSGGVGGSGVPSASDNIFIDQQSFTTANPVILINGNVAFQNLTISKNVIPFELNSSNPVNVDVYGEISIRAVTFTNNISGVINLKSSSSSVKQMNFGTWNWKADFNFQGEGKYAINSPILLPENTFTFTKGEIDLNQNDIVCKDFKATSSFKKKLNATNSDILTYNSWDAKSSKFTFNYSQARLYNLNNDPNAVNKDGASYQVMQSAKSPSNKAISSIVIADDTVSCGNNCDGMLYIDTVVTTCPPYTVTNWVGASGGPPWGDTITGLCPGSYTAVVQDGCLALFGQAANVLGHPPIVPISEIITQPTCKGNCDGSISVTVIGASYATWTFTWNPVGGVVNTAFTTTSYSSLCTGNYTLQAQDGHGCDTTFNYIVPEPDSVYANVTVVDINCNGDCTGSATSNPTGGTPGYSYSWTPATGNPAVDTAQTFPNLCAGINYSVTVTDANGCFNDTTIQVTEPPAIVLDTVTTNVTCGGACDGTITVTVLGGGTPNFSHHWSNGQINNGLVGMISSLCPGNYTDTVRDGNGCDTIISFTITEPSILTTSTVPVDVTCNGACNGMATTFPVGGAGGYTYSWSCGPSTFDSITGLCPTPQCIVTVTDANNCTVQDTFSINEPPVLVVNPSSTNISCPGFCDGTATASPTGGTGNPAVDFTYVWTGPGGPYNTQSIASLCPGTYILTVTDSFGCQAIDSVTITEPLPITLTMSSTDESCAGSCDGTASVSISGGTGNPAVDFTYVWTSIPAGQVGPGQGTDSIFNLCAGTYIVNVTDSSGCPASAQVTVNPQTPIVDNLVTTNLSCNGICNGTATVSPTGGIPPYTVSWNGGLPVVVPNGGFDTEVGLCAGANTVTIIDNNGCPLVVNFNISEPPALTTNTNITDVTCFGACDGTAITVPGGGTAPYTFVWNSIPAGAPFPIIGDSVSSLCAGTYYVQITDDSLCTLNDTITIIEPNQILPNPQFTDVTCNGANNGSALSLPTGGVPPYSWVWTGPGGPYNSQAIGPLSAGQYIVTVTDSNGCTGVDTINLTNPPVLTVSASATAASCGTVCDGTALATPNGGTAPYSYSWNTVPPQTNQSATGLCAGTYTVTVIDSNGCTAQDTTTINNLITITINPSVINISCNGICDGMATAIPSGGVNPYTYQWSNGDQTQTADSLCPGWVFVTVTDSNGCASTDSINMPVAPPVLVPNSTIVQPISCNGVCDGMVASAPSGGTPPYTVVWSLPNGIDTNNVCAGTVVVTVTDSANCSQSDTIYMIEPDTISPNATIVDIQCNGDTTGSITLNPTGGTPGYTYVWVPNVSTTNSASNLPAGTYTVTITDTAGCSRTDNYIITEPPALSTTPISRDISCNGACDGMAAVIVGGGTPPYTYSWAPNGQTNDSIFNLCPPFLTNTVTVIDSNGCISSQTITITQPLPLLANVTGTPIGCSSVCDGTAISNPTGGTGPYQFQWSANAAPNPLNGQSISNLCADTFTVTVTDSKGCTDQGTYIVTEPTALAVTLDSTNVTCNGANDGTATATPTGGTPPYSYSWVGGCLAAPDTNASISGLCPGVYTVTVTDSANCIFVGSVIITEPTLIDDNEVVVGANCGVCDGSIVVFPSGGTPGYNHSWSNGATTPNNPNLCAGFYTDTITDANGCVALFTIGVSNPTGPSGVTPTVNDATCYGACDGSINVIPIGGTPAYSYSWSSIPPGGPYANDSTITGLCAGTYNLTVTDALNCILATTLVVGQTDSITANETFTNASCSGTCDGTASVTPTGGTGPFTYLWSHNGSTASSASGLCAGPVSVTITDNNGCTKVVNFNITAPNALSISSSATDALCNGTCDGTATATPAGGTAPYQYQWNDPLAQTTQTATGLCAGTYIVTVTDFNGCSGNDTVTVNDPTLIDDNEIVTDATCGVCDGSITLAPTGGVGPYQFNWPTIGATTATVNALCAGSYPVDITDNNGCTQSFLIAVSNPNGPGVNVSSTNASCNGVCDGSATATATSGPAPYQYLWAPGGQTTSSVNGLCAGNYTVQVTDANGCITVMPVTIIDNNAISATVTKVDATCNGNCDGFAQVIPNGGVPPYSYSWVGGPATGQTVSGVGGLCAGNYTVTITDALGCSHVENITINESNVLTVSTSGIAANCNGSCDGQATATPAGGTAPYTYSWSTGATTPTITALCAGSYTVTVTDINGCSATGNIMIGDGIAITANITTVDATCGACDGSATATAGGGSGAPYGYSWSPLGQTTPSVNNLCPGAYNLTITDNLGCTELFTVLINNANGPTLSTLADSVTCFGSCDGLAYTSVLAGNPNYLFQWDDPALQTTDSASGLCAGLYTVVVQDALGCISVDSVTVPTPQEILANATTTNPTCPGACDGTATVNPSGGVGSFTVQWGASAGNQNTPTATGLCAGTHLVTITDSKGCTKVDSVTITDPSSLSITASATSATCNGSCDGTAVATVSGGTPGYLYSWNSVPSQPNALATGLCPGSYTVTVTDANGCSDTASVVVPNPTGLTTISTPTSPTCNGVCDGSITTTPNGGVAPYSYLWSNGDTSQTTSSTLCAGTYNVIVIDANNCTAYDTITLTPAPMLNDSTVVNGPTCGLCDGSATSTPTGGVGPFDFTWTDPLNPLPPLQTDLGVASSTIVGLCAGTYDLEITDLGTGCTYTYTIIVNSVNGPTLLTSATDETCTNACNGTTTVSASGGTAPYTYSWSPTGPPTDTNQTATGLCAGTYTVTVTDANNCISSDTITVNPSNGLNLAISSIVPETCFGNCDASATVVTGAGSPPFTYTWNPTGQITPTATGLCVGNYMVVVTDSSNCMDSISANVTGPNILTVTASINTPISCNNSNDGVAIANVAGGTAGYSYVWNTVPAQTSQMATGLGAGTYIVTVTDANGCTAMDTVTLTEPSAILANETLTFPNCNLCDGSISVAPTGGVGPYTYLWTTPSAPPSPQPVTATINNLCAGAYTLVITDSTGCQANFAYPLSNIAGPVPNTTVTNVSCNGDCNGAISAAPSGGTAPYAYFWNPSGDTTNSISGLCAGQYSLNVTDANGCVGVAIDSVTQPDVLLANINSSNVSCNASCDGWAVSNTLGGTAPFSYNWTPGNLPQDSITNLCPGTYYVTVTDSNNCIVNDSVTIIAPSTITVTNATTSVSCSSACDGAATVTPAGGVGPYTYQWNGNTAPGQTNTLNNLCFGNNIVVIIDQNGCSIIDTVAIGAIDTVIADAGPDTTICLGDFVQLKGVPTGIFTSVEWFVLPGMFSIGTTDTLTFTPTATGTICFVYQVNGPCIATDTVCITVEALPIIDAGPNVSIIEGGSTTLSASGGSNYTWTPGSTLSDSTIANPVATPTQTTTYYVTGYSPNGCPATDSVTVTVLPTVKFPDGISPNGDGKNDVWIIDFIEQFPNNVVEIYNRWGELLFHADGYQQDWDGTYNGEPLPVGTYYYVIELNEEGYEPYTGPITVLR
ncbi:MAG: gliding motility-associated C-terminal domain-containing protein [Flavobacteriales bacterium]|nr:gliding motility-associated C-terminal domain-containing protein [Flavobacteriales bacterium]